MKRLLSAGFICAVAITTLSAVSVPVRTKTGIVASQNEIASRIGADAIDDGGNAVDAAVATAFALAVVHPTAGNLGGGGFLVYRPASGQPVAYDFREMAPGKSSPTMFLEGGKYSSHAHHDSYLSVGVPGTVAGLHLAWNRARQAAVEAARRSGDRAGARRVHRQRRTGAVAPGRAPAVQRDLAGRCGAVLKERRAVRRGRHLEAARSRADARAHRGAGARRILRGRDGAGGRERNARARRADYPRGSETVQTDPARARHGHVPRLRSSRCRRSAPAASR